MKRSIISLSKFLLSEAWASSVKASSGLLPPPNHKVYDCFLFNNEISILKLRLLTLYDYVDHFVICESATSFSGKPKNLYYKDNECLFTEFKEKIRHYIIPEPPSSAYITNPANPSTTTSEFWQRNQIAVAIAESKKSDLILVSDVDEIPNPIQLPIIRKLCYYADCTVFLSQFWFLLFLNVKVKGRHDTIFKRKSKRDNCLNDQWLGTFACTARRIRRQYRSDINAIWGIKWGNGFFREQIVKDGGWHFSYMGGVELLLSKISDCGTPSLSMEAISEIRSGHFCGCNLTINANHSYPHTLVSDAKSWEHLTLHDSSFEQLANELKKGLQVDKK